MSLQRHPKKRVQLSIDNKREICEYAKQNSTLNHADIAKHFNDKYNFNMNRSTVTKILAKKEKWLNILSTKQDPSTVRQRSVKYPRLNKAMELWVNQAIAMNLPLSDQILQEKGLEFAESFNIEDDDIRCSNGWVYKFKKRIGIHKITLHGEANSASLTDIAEERLSLQQVLAEYDLENIYNADETGLFYRMEPNQTLSTSSIAGRKRVNFKLNC